MVSSIIATITRFLAICVVILLVPSNGFVSFPFQNRANFISYVFSLYFNRLHKHVALRDMIVV